MQCVIGDCTGAVGVVTIVGIGMSGLAWNIPWWDWMWGAGLPYQHSVLQ
jgi:hypothetical protein